ncbi:hypothetical protein Trydic_g20063 [Trypoxylus dichotomus]
MHKHNQFFDEPLSIVNAFSQHFCDVYQFSTSFSTDSSNCGLVPVHVNILSESDILSAIKSLKNKLTSGCDQVSSFVLKDFSLIFLRPLLSIFNLILRTSTFPERWKLARVCPVFRNDDMSDVSNYRPISTVTNLCTFLQYASEVIDGHGQVDVLYTDISKARDRIDPGILLRKLQGIGYSDFLVRLLQSCLHK